MHLPRLWLASIVVIGCSGNGSKGTPPPPPPSADDGGAEAPVVDQGPPPPDASTDPVNTAAAPAGFWTKGDPGCPPGAKLTGTPGRQVYCHDSAGAMHGPSARWNDDGKLVELTMYEAGKREGLSTTYYPDGKKQSEVAYHRGNMHGPSLGWHPGGQKRREGAYRDGRPDGKFTVWDEGGKELGSFTMRDGTGHYLDWHPNGQQSLDQDMIDGQAHGLSVSWHASGQKSTEMRFVRDRPVGRTTSWDEQGRKRSEGQYDSAGESTGDWIYYDDAGGVVRVDRYAGGRQVATIDYQDGKPLARPLPPQGQCTSDDGVASAYRQATGKELGREHRCIDRPSHFPWVVFVGGFAHDRGCMEQDVLIDCKVGKIDAPSVLDRAGWKQARAPARAKMAMDYVTEIELAWAGSMSDDPDKPKVVNQADGGVTITGWIAEPAGMQRGRTLHLTEYRFSPAGDLATRVARTIRTDR